MLAIYRLRPHTSTQTRTCACTRTTRHATHTPTYLLYPPTHPPNTPPTHTPHIAPLHLPGASPAGGGSYTAHTWQKWLTFGPSITGHDHCTRPTQKIPNSRPPDCPRSSGNAIGARTSFCEAKLAPECSSIGKNDANQAPHIGGKQPRTEATATAPGNAGQCARGSLGRSASASCRTHSTLAAAHTAKTVRNRAARG